MMRSSSHERPRRLLKSFRGRILFGFAVAALCPLLVMAYQGYQFARREIVAQQEAYLGTMLAARRARLADWLDERRSDLAFLGVTPCARAGCGIGCPDHPGSTDCACDTLGLFRGRSAAYEVIATFDLKWQPLDESRQAACPHDLAMDSAFMAELADAAGLVVNQPAMNCDGRICLEMAHPLLDPQGAKAGYVVACLNLSKAIDPILMDRTGLGRTGKVYLVSEDGRIQSEPFANAGLVGKPAAPRSSGWPAASLPEPRSSGVPAAAPAADDSASGAVREYDDFRGEPVLGARCDFPGMPFRIVAEIDQAEAFANLDTLAWRVAITAVVALGAALFLSLRSASRLSQPLRAMADVARRIAAGSHGERIGPVEPAEAAEVAAAFDQMMNELAAAQRRLSHAAALAAIGELSTSLVHEIRNPLSSIKVNIQALKRKVEGDSAHTELAEIASRQVDRVELLLGELLQYGKPLAMKPGPVRFGDLVRDALEVVEDKAACAGVRLDVDRDADAALLQVDREQMGRALVNLLTNAIQAAAADGRTDGGRVSVRGALIPERPGLFGITVADNGPGIPEAVKGKLFQPFVTTREEGTGLGLANVKKIAESHGGSVAAMNGSHGAAFVLAVPVAAK